MARTVGKKYTKVTVLRDGKPKQVRMEVSRAKKLRATRAANKTKKAEQARLGETTKLIPKPYRDLVDPATIDEAVNAQIAGENAPFELGKLEAQRQFEANAAASASLDAQTQASMDTLIQNAQARQAGLQQINGQRIAAMAQSDQAGAAAVAHALGVAGGGMVNQMVQQQTSGGRALDAANGVQGVWADQLMQGAQRDFYERGKGISAITQSAFTEGQRQQLTGVLSRISAQMQANQARRPELIAKRAAEEAQFTFEQQTAQQALGQQEFENSLAAKKLKTDRMSIKQRDRAAKIAAEQRDRASQRSSNATVRAAEIRAEAALRKDRDSQASGLSKETRKSVIEAKKAIEKKLALVGKVRATDADGNKDFYSVGDVFPGSKGPWREAFNLLTAPEVGLTANQAATWASSWYASSIRGKPYANIKALLDNRGVTGAARNRILNLTDASTRPIQGPPAPESTNHSTAASRGLQQARSWLSSQRPGSVKKGRVITAGGVKFKVIDADVQPIADGGRVVKVTYRLRGPGGGTVSYSFNTRR